VVETVESRIVGVVSIDTEECDSCRMCAVFCPTGALLKLDEGGRKDLIHRPSACVQCRLCESLCPKSAISVGSSVPIEQFLGGKAICYGMKQPAWTPNRPDSLFQKMRLVLGEDTEMCMF
jgi:ferredoxin